MIVRMSKVEIAGPKNLLLPVLGTIRDLEVFHIEPDHRRFVDRERFAAVTAVVPDERILAERRSLDELAAKIDELIGYLPRDEGGEIIADTPAILETVSTALDEHLRSCRNWSRSAEQLREELAELDRHTLFIEALESLLAGKRRPRLVEFIGITLKEDSVQTRLRDLLERVTNGCFELFATRARDSTPTVLLAVPRQSADRIKKILSSESIPELVFPQGSPGMGLNERMEYVRRRMAEISAELAETQEKLRTFARDWLPAYREVRIRCGRRLVLLTTTADLFETKHCFFLYGWLPSEKMATLSEKLGASYRGRILVSEQEIARHELDDVPVLLRNSFYFRPFEVFTGLLPLPSYTSFDPTLFIGLFFPVFFGLILGDAGYGMLLFMTALTVGRVFRAKVLVHDLARILLVCSLYATLFGLAFGEFFGELGHTLFGLHPLWLSRTEAIIPMLMFSFSVGIFHVLLGLFLGFLVALRKRVVNEILFKLANILGILFLVAYFLMQEIHIPAQVHRALAIGAALVVVLAIFGGGLLAPLELLKSIGNIISYARIMAIGLASVLLATVANVLGGMTGDILTGVLVAVLFHAINIILGVFAPTIQSLRLHFVEFFSKFMEHGGRKYHPFK